MLPPVRLRSVCGSGGTVPHLPRGARARTPRLHCMRRRRPTIIVLATAVTDGCPSGAPPGPRPSRARRPHGGLARLGGARARFVPRRPPAPRAAHPRQRPCLHAGRLLDTHRPDGHRDGGAVRAPRPAECPTSASRRHSDRPGRRAARRGGRHLPHAGRQRVWLPGRLGPPRLRRRRRPVGLRPAYRALPARLPARSRASRSCGCRSACTAPCARRRRVCAGRPGHPRLCRRAAASRSDGPGPVAAAIAGAFGRPRLHPRHGRGARRPPLGRRPGRRTPPVYALLAGRPPAVAPAVARLRVSHRESVCVCRTTRFSWHLQCGCLRVCM